MLRLLFHSDKMKRIPSKITLDPLYRRHYMKKILINKRGIITCAGYHHKLNCDIAVRRGEYKQGLDWRTYRPFPNLACHVPNRCACVVQNGSNTKPSKSGILHDSCYSITSKILSKESPDSMEIVKLTVVPLDLKTRKMKEMRHILSKTDYYSNGNNIVAPSTQTKLKLSKPFNSPLSKSTEKLGEKVVGSKSMETSTKKTSIKPQTYNCTDCNKSCDPSVCHPPKKSLTFEHDPSQGVFEEKEIGLTNSVKNNFSFINKTDTLCKSAVNTIKVPTVGKGNSHLGSALNQQEHTTHKEPSNLSLSKNIICEQLSASFDVNSTTKAASSEPSNIFPIDESGGVRSWPSSLFEKSKYYPVNNEGVILDKLQKIVPIRKPNNVSNSSNVNSEPIFKPSPGPKPIGKELNKKSLVVDSRMFYENPDQKGRLTKPSTGGSDPLTETGLKNGDERQQVSKSKGFKIDKIWWPTEEIVLQRQKLTEMGQTMRFTDDSFHQKERESSSVSSATRPSLEQCLEQFLCESVEPAALESLQRREPNVGERKPESSLVTKGSKKAKPVLVDDVPLNLEKPELSSNPGSSASCAKRQDEMGVQSAKETQNALKKKEGEKDSCRKSEKPAQDISQPTETELILFNGLSNPIQTESSSTPDSQVCLEKHLDPFISHSTDKIDKDYSKQNSGVKLNSEKINCESKPGAQNIPPENSSQSKNEPILLKNDSSKSKKTESSSTSGSQVDYVDRRDRFNVQHAEMSKIDGLQKKEVKTDTSNKSKLSVQKNSLAKGENVTESKVEPILTNNNSSNSTKIELSLPSDSKAEYVKQLNQYNIGLVETAKIDDSQRKVVEKRASCENKSGSQNIPQGTRRNVTESKIELNLSSSDLSKLKSQSSSTSNPNFDHVSHLDQFNIQVVEISKFNDSHRKEAKQNATSESKSQNIPRAEGRNEIESKVEPILINNNSSKLNKIESSSDSQVNHVKPLDQFNNRLVEMSKIDDLQKKEATKGTSHKSKPRVENISLANGRNTNESKVEPASLDNDLSKSKKNESSSTCDSKVNVKHLDQFNIQRAEMSKIDDLQREEGKKGVSRENKAGVEIVSQPRKSHKSQMKTDSDTGHVQHRQNQSYIQSDNSNKNSDYGNENLDASADPKPNVQNVSSLKEKSKIVTTGFSRLHDDKPRSTKTDAQVSPESHSLPFDIPLAETSKMVNLGNKEMKSDSNRESTTENVQKMSIARNRTPIQLADHSSQPKEGKKEVLKEKHSIPDVGKEKNLKPISIGLIESNKDMDLRKKEKNKDINCGAKPRVQNVHLTTQIKNNELKSAAKEKVSDPGIGKYLKIFQSKSATGKEVQMSKEGIFLGEYPSKSQDLSKSIAGKKVKNIEHFVSTGSEFPKTKNGNQKNRWMITEISKKIHKYLSKRNLGETFMKSMVGQNSKRKSSKENKPEKCLSNVKPEIIRISVNKDNFPSTPNYDNVMNIITSIDKSGVIIQKDFYITEKIISKINEEKEKKKPEPSEPSKVECSEKVKFAIEPDVNKDGRALNKTTFANQTGEKNHDNRSNNNLLQEKVESKMNNEVLEKVSEATEKNNTLSANSKHTPFEDEMVNLENMKAETSRKNQGVQGLSVEENNEFKKEIKQPEGNLRIQNLEKPILNSKPQVEKKLSDNLEMTQNSENSSVESAPASSGCTLKGKPEIIKLPINRGDIQPVHSTETNDAELIASIDKSAVIINKDMYIAEKIVKKIKDVKDEKTPKVHTADRHSITYDVKKEENLEKMIEKKDFTGLQGKQNIQLKENMLEETQVNKLLESPKVERMNTEKLKNDHIMNLKDVDKTNLMSTQRNDTFNYINKVSVESHDSKDALNAIPVKKNEPIYGLDKINIILNDLEKMEAFSGKTPAVSGDARSKLKRVHQKKGFQSMETNINIDVNTQTTISLSNDGKNANIEVHEREVLADKRLPVPFRSETLFQLQGKPESLDDNIRALELTKAKIKSTMVKNKVTHNVPVASVHLINAAAVEAKKQSDKDIKVNFPLEGGDKTKQEIKSPSVGSEENKVMSKPVVEKRSDAPSHKRKHSTLTMSKPKDIPKNQDLKEIKVIAPKEVKAVNRSSIKRVKFSEDKLMKPIRPLRNPKTLAKNELVRNIVDTIKQKKNIRSTKSLRQVIKHTFPKRIDITQSTKTGGKKVQFDITGAGAKTVPMKKSLNLSKRDEAIINNILRKKGILRCNRIKRIGSQKRRRSLMAQPQNLKTDEGKQVQPKPDPKLDLKKTRRNNFNNVSRPQGSEKRFRKVESDNSKSTSATVDNKIYTALPTSSNTCKKEVPKEVPQIIPEVGVNKSVEGQNLTKEVKKDFEIDLGKLYRETNPIFNFKKSRFSLKPEEILDFPFMCNHEDKGQPSPFDGIINVSPEKNPDLRAALSQYPSVSRVLNLTMSEGSKAELRKWKKKMVKQLGEKEFQYFYKGQLEQGSEFYRAIRSALLGDHISKGLKPSTELCLNSIKGVLNQITNIRALESHVVHSKLAYRGVIDCVAKYRNNNFLIEWKRSDKPKPLLRSMYDAPLQLSAYLGGLSYDPNYKFQVDGGLIVVAYSDGAPADIFQLSLDKCNDYWKKWLLRYHRYIVTQNSCHKKQ